MIILPAIDIKDGSCVRLYKGDYSTAEKVAEDAVTTAKGFEHDGAAWMHMVDLDGAKAKKPINDELILNVRNNTKLNIEVGGGIRDMASIEYYLEKGINRVILGSAALQNPELVREAAAKYGKHIAVGIDALNEMVAAEGWVEKSTVNYIEMAKRMENIGVKYIIFTDISKDGTLSGPNFDQLQRLNDAVSCNIIASGGVSKLDDIVKLNELGCYGAIAGKAIYSGALSLDDAVISSQKVSGTVLQKNVTDELERYFKKAELIPAVVQENSTGEVLMLAYMNLESLKRTLETGYTWFWSRSRQEYWNKGATSGHLQKVISITSDCDDDTLLIKVDQIGAACHTGRHSCFYRKIK